MKIYDIKSFVYFVYSQFTYIRDVIITSVVYYTGRIKARNTNRLKLLCDQLDLLFLLSEYL